MLIWATPGQRGFGTGRSSRTPAALLNSTPIPSQSRVSTVQGVARMETARNQQEALRKAAELNQMLNSLDKVDDEGRRASLLDTLCATEDVLSMPMYSTPPGISSGELTVDLLKHQACTLVYSWWQRYLLCSAYLQLQALEWCIQRENPVLPNAESDKAVQFWQIRKRGQQVKFFHSYRVWLIYTRTAILL